MAKRPTGRLEEKWLEGWERKKDGKEAKVAKREEDDWGRKMWRWAKESEARDRISGSGNVKEELKHAEEITLCVTW